MAQITLTDLLGEIVVSPTSAKPHSRQAQFGQYLTPDSISAFMVKLFPPFPEHIRLLDAGAGKGALTTAFVKCWQDQGGVGCITAHAYELDRRMMAELHRVAGTLHSNKGVNVEVFEGDFIERAASLLRLRRGPRYTHAILNLPYKKINNVSNHRIFLRIIGLETVSLYSAFVGLAVEMMEKNGEVVAIIPRSFCNGPYYQPFRQFIFTRAAIRHIHLFKARNKAFKSDGVLQENVIVRLTRGAQQGEVVVSTSTDAVSSADCHRLLRAYYCASRAPT